MCPAGVPVRISDNLFRHRDTCNVYVIRTDRDAVLIDCGDGSVFDRLADYGVDRVTDVLVTHHHRDNVQGLPRAVDHGARIWVPWVEQDLFTKVDDQWQMRDVMNTYNVRQDRFSLLESVPITGTLPEYRAPRFNGRRYRIIPTPGHTVGSDSVIVRIDGRRVAFTGDLIYGPGKVWSMAATQWTYTGAEGIGASILSLMDIRDREPDLLLPTHGQPIDQPADAIDLLVKRLIAVLQFRRSDYRDILEWRKEPYKVITQHLLQDRTGSANSFVLISETGNALLIDFGYTANTGIPAGSDRASRRPWLHGLDHLRDHGVTRVEVAVPTHYHDDHVAGFQLLQDVLGTEVWVPANFVDVLAHPTHYDLPCLWYDPIRADRTIVLDQPVRWHEYDLTFHDLPGHTLYAVAISFTVDGRKVLATGDHQQDRWLNYVYKNRFRIGDYSHSAELYRRLAPDLIIAGHWQPIAVDADYLDDLATAGAELTRLHEDLLPLADIDLGAEGFGASIDPYLSEIAAGTPSRYNVAVRNPFASRQTAVTRLVVPDGWSVDPDRIEFDLGPAGADAAEFAVTPPAGLRVRRARIAVDLTVGLTRFGQHAEALVTVS